MENPTRYHVVQKQKNQVRQYLHESFRGADNDATNGALTGSIGSEGNGTPVDTGPPSQVQPMVVQSAPPGPAVQQPKPQHPHLASYPHAPALLGRVPGVMSASPDPISGAMSPGLSSVATSNSEVSHLSTYSKRNEKPIITLKTSLTIISFILKHLGRYSGDFVKLSC